MFAEDQIEKYKQEAKEMRESEEIMTQQLDKATTKLSIEQKKNDKMAAATQGIKSLYE